MEAIGKDTALNKWSALQCVALRCTALQCVAVCCSVLQCVTVCCCVLLCVAVRCCVLEKRIKNGGNKQRHGI